MNTYSIKDADIVKIIADLAADMYKRACRQGSPEQWHGQIAGYPDGRIEVYNIVYGPFTSVDLYYGRAYLIADIRGEDYQYVETDANPNEDAEAYEREIDGLIDEDASDIIDMPATMQAYREWMADQEDGAARSSVVERLDDILRGLGI